LTTILKILLILSEKTVASQLRERFAEQRRSDSGDAANHAAPGDVDGHSEF
jgi:hypothetical protein